MACNRWSVFVDRLPVLFGLALPISIAGCEPSKRKLNSQDDLCLIPTTWAKLFDVLSRLSHADTVRSPVQLPPVVLLNLPNEPALPLTSTASNPLTVPLCVAPLTRVIVVLPVTSVVPSSPCLYDSSCQTLLRPYVSVTDGCVSPVLPMKR